MAENDNEKRGQKHAGPAYPARYAKLGRIDFSNPSRRLILGLGVAALCILLVIVLLAT